MRSGCNYLDKYFVLFTWHQLGNEPVDVQIRNFCYHWISSSDYLELLYIFTLIKRCLRHFLISLFTFIAKSNWPFFSFEGEKKFSFASIFLISTSLPNYWNFSCMHFWSVCCCYMLGFITHIYTHTNTFLLSSLQICLLVYQTFIICYLSVSVS